MAFMKSQNGRDKLKYIMVIFIILKNLDQKKINMETYYKIRYKIWSEKNLIYCKNLQIVNKIAHNYVSDSGNLPKEIRKYSSNAT